MPSLRIALTASALTLLAGCGAGPDITPTDSASLVPTVAEPSPTPLDSSPSDDVSLPGPLVAAPKVVPPSSPGPISRDGSVEEVVALEPATSANTEPKRPVPPTDRSDPIAVARFVAAAWGNLGTGLTPWHLDARPFLTHEFAAAVTTTRPLVEGVEVSSQVVATTAGDGGLPIRVTVTLEQTRSIDGTVGPHTTLTVVEVVLVNDEAGWLVGSLERVA